MNYTTITINGNEYKLRVTTRTCVQLEKSLGVNPIQIFMDLEEGKLPTLTNIVTMLFMMLQPLNHGISLEDTYELFDAYMAEGNQMFGIIPVFMEVFQNAGFISKTQENEKN